MFQTKHPRVNTAKYPADLWNKPTGGLPPQGIHSFLVAFSSSERNGSEALQSGDFSTSSARHPFPVHAL